MTQTCWSDSIDHRDPLWKKGRDYQLVCGLETAPNLRLCSLGENASKSNRFIPWRVNSRLPPPEEPGDWAWFLNLDTEKWEFIQWLGPRWKELSHTTCARHHNKKKKSKDHRKNIQKALVGKPKPVGFGEKVSIAKRGINPFPDGIPPEIIARRSTTRIVNGKRWTKEQKQRASEKQKLSKEEIKKRSELIKNSGINLELWGSISKVASLLGLSSPSASWFLKTHYKNYDFDDYGPSS